jgi:hypothetical protein
MFEGNIGLMSHFPFAYILKLKVYGHEETGFHLRSLILFGMLA